MNEPIALNHGCRAARASEHRDEIGRSTNYASKTETYATVKRGNHRNGRDSQRRHLRSLGLFWR